MDNVLDEVYNISIAAERVTAAKVPATRINGVFTMILDTIKNASLYYSAGERIEKALKYLENNDLLKIENGKYEIDGSDIYVIVQDYDTKPQKQGKWESHKKYIDIQYIIKGNEKIGYTNIENLTVSEQYDESKDLIFYEGNGDFLTLKEKDFAIFYPNDAHMPGIAVLEPQCVKKAVVKIKV